MTKQTRQTALDALRREFAGAIIVPACDEVRTIFNAMIDRRPSVFAQCANVNDVVRAVHLSRSLGLEIAVRGGGHSVAGRALTEDGVVIDLRRMNTVSVDSESRAATVCGGVTMSHLDRGTEQCGLMTIDDRSVASRPRAPINADLKFSRA